MEWWFTQKRINEVQDGLQGTTFSEEWSVGNACGVQVSSKPEKVKVLEYFGINCRSVSASMCLTTM